MADHAPATDAQAAPAAKSAGGILPWVIVGVVAAAIGAAAPFGMSMLSAGGSSHHEGAPAAETADSGHGSSHGGGSHGGGSHGAAVSTSTSPMVFVTYGEVTVNLDEQRMNRYLRLKIVLHVRRADETVVKAAMSEKELLLRNWLVSHLSDKELDDIRGKAGQNMLRREIRDHFNAALFPDHYERIYDVLFQEFNVQ
ncbi:flagellar basal body-associated FliL family protein [Planctomicrobium piriforme]|uniref:Flagellar protein FliL n=1 Tax=Planctomicrobium piriforme TaxID=1576369 RepID=A0A1I3HLI5_9PLAN|nr:flagellar basal body-associated FliL family protein [Planctomicrobium piriforme]SFI36596.1 Flagellar basal body-associated protein FliL [Planctomicrobium piriforme]